MAPPLSPSLTPLAASLFRTLHGNTSSVLAVAVTLDGRQVVSGSYGNTLRVWNLATGQTKTMLQGSAITVAVTHGRYVVSGSADNTLRVWDLQNGKEILMLTIDAPVKACVVAPDNRTIVAGDGFERLHFLQQQSLDRPKTGERGGFWKRLWGRSR